MKKYFLTGLAILLPLILTFLIVGFVVNIVTAPFLSSMMKTLNYYDVFNKPFLFLSAESTLLISSKIFILGGLIAIILGVGYLGRVFLLKWLGRFGDYIMHRIPIINKIYKATQDVVHTLFVPKKDSEPNFSAVVLAPFPHKNAYSLGFITSREGGIEGDLEQHQGLISIFVPGTPNPTMGFMLLFDKGSLIPLDITVEEALKFVVSVGVIFPSILQKDVSAK